MTRARLISRSNSAKAPSMGRKSLPWAVLMLRLAPRPSRIRRAACRFRCRQAACRAASVVPVRGSLGGRSGGDRRWGVIDAPDRSDIVFGVPPLPVAVLPRVDQPALFEPFQGGGADPHLVGRFSNAHTSSPEASLPRPFWVIRDHSRPWAARRRAPAATLRHS